jgi:G3E family GTPase
MQLLIVTGFLGAGKTTFLSQALRRGELGRTALLVNEFGRADVDGALLAGAAAGAPLVQLANGCVCCKVQDDFVGAVRGLWNRVRAGELVLDRVVLETTGLADPAPLLAHLSGSKVLREAIEDVRALTVVDGLLGHDVLQQHVEARHQVACADLLLLSKADCLDNPAVLRWQNELQARNPYAPLVLVDHGTPREQHWLAWLATAKAFHHSGETGQHDHHEHHNHQHHGDSHDHGHHSDAVHAHHSEGIASFHLRSGALASRDVLQAWVSTLVLLHAEQLLRLKGFVCLAGEAQPLLLQGAMDGIRITPWAGGGVTGTELVAIARQMNEPRHHDGLRRSLLSINHDATLAQEAA